MEVCVCTGVATDDGRQLLVLRFRRRGFRTAKRLDLVPLLVRIYNGVIKISMVLVAVSWRRRADRRECVQGVKAGVLPAADAPVGGDAVIVGFSQGRCALRRGQHGYVHVVNRPPPTRHQHVVAVAAAVVAVHGQGTRGQAVVPVSVTMVHMVHLMLEVMQMVNLRFGEDVRRDFRLLPATDPLQRVRRERHGRGRADEGSVLGLPGCKSNTLLLRFFSPIS